MTNEEFKRLYGSDYMLEEFKNLRWNGPSYMPVTTLSDHTGSCQMASGLFLHHESQHQREILSARMRAMADLLSARKWVKNHDRVVALDPLKDEEDEWDIEI